MKSAKTVIVLGASVVSAVVAIIGLVPQFLSLERSRSSDVVFVTSDDGVSFPESARAQQILETLRREEIATGRFSVFLRNMGNAPAKGVEISIRGSRQIEQIRFLPSVDEDPVGFNVLRAEISGDSRSARIDLADLAAGQQIRIDALYFQVAATKAGDDFNVNAIADGVPARLGLFEYQQSNARLFYRVVASAWLFVISMGLMAVYFLVRFPSSHVVRACAQYAHGLSSSLPFVADAADAYSSQAKARLRSFCVKVMWTLYQRDVSVFDGKNHSQPHVPWAMGGARWSYYQQNIDDQSLIFTAIGDAYYCVCIVRSPGILEDLWNKEEAQREFVLSLVADDVANQIAVIVPGKPDGKMLSGVAALIDEMSATNSRTKIHLLTGSEQQIADEIVEILRPPKSPDHPAGADT